MFERFQTFLQSLTNPTAEAEFTPDDPRVAVTALCFQVMEADGNVSKEELQRMRVLLKQRFSLDEAKLDALLEVGQEAGKEAVDYYRFTSDLKRTLNEEQRLEFIGILWEIVHADGVRSEMEDHVIWRVADLLGVSGRDRILQRQQAEARMPGGTEVDAL